MTLLGIIAIAYGVDTDEKILLFLRNCRGELYSEKPFYRAGSMHGRVLLRAIIVGGTGLGRLSESFQKELPDIDLTRGRIRSIGFTLPGQKTTIRLFFALRSLAVQKTVGYSSVGHSSLVGVPRQPTKNRDFKPIFIGCAQS